jgi:raffinose/stachyose/melibiose transport system permease protein
MATTAPRTAGRRTTNPTGTEIRPDRNRLPRAFYWMVVPAVVLFLAFHTIPVLQGIFYSFTDSPGYGD